MENKKIQSENTHQLKGQRTREHKELKWKHGNTEAVNSFNPKKRHHRKRKKAQISFKVSNDPIADLLIRIKNGGMRKKISITVPYSKVKHRILEILNNQYIDSFDVKMEGKKKYFVIYLKYYNNLPALKGVRRISKPGLRVYTKAADMPQVLKGLGTVIVSTSRGIITDEEARSKTIGGEVLAYIW